MDHENKQTEGHLGKHPSHRPPHPTRNSTSTAAEDAQKAARPGHFPASSSWHRGKTICERHEKSVWCGEWLQLVWLVASTQLQTCEEGLGSIIPRCSTCFGYRLFIKQVGPFEGPENACDGGPLQEGVRFSGTCFCMGVLQMTSTWLVEMPTRLI